MSQVRIYVCIYIIKKPQMHSTPPAADSRSFPADKPARTGLPWIGHWRTAWNAGDGARRVGRPRTGRLIRFVMSTLDKALLILAGEGGWNRAAPRVGSAELLVSLSRGDASSSSAPAAANKVGLVRLANLAGANLHVVVEAHQLVCQVIVR